ncbi:ATP-binding protein [Methylomonas koyamae]|uniref:endopeptidase La n=1 Tax=Methylomonas koyamae TaxID=702114 RepID=A0A291IDL0_9GAMM|nr:ATP-binding protein [Methylomonas koyamae]ATG88402.1 ATP-dependent protease [Methylomonas koyamae]OAI26415.1 ATP-dependent protease [Methylomonas koyamae]
MLDHLKLPAAALKLTIDLPAADAGSRYNGILGQNRAQSALAFGIAMKAPGYNIFVMGDPGTGRLSMVSHYLTGYAEQQESPLSYAYVENFENPREPVAVELPSGEGHSFAKDVEKLIDNVLATFPAAFESPSYQQKKTAIERRFNQRYNAAIDLVDSKARAMGVALYRDNDSITFLPIRNNKALDEEQFTLLPEAERDAFHQHTEELEEYLGDVLLELPQWRRTLAEEIRQLDSDTIKLALEPLLAELTDKYQNVDDVITYLAEIEKNLSNTISDFLMPSRNPENREIIAKRQMLIEQYLPNILVDCKHDAAGAPVIYEPHPIYQNLFGRIEYVSDQGTLITNYRRICPGSLHRANGGYLILDAEKVLTYPFVWEGLKRALKAGKIEIESPYSELGINTITLKPEVIPLNVKVILVGTRDIYYLLEELDSEFNEMFRVLADFDDHIKRTPDSIGQFVQIMKQQARDAGAKPLTDLALVRLIEHSCRLAENQQRLSAHVNNCLEIIAEANLLGSQTGASEIGKAEIELALAAREQRNGRIAEAILEEMLDGTILIDTDGEAIGKVNGLTVMDIGGSSFGAPARITATVHPGSRGIVDIEREVELGQPIHSKGVMILTGYLGHCYAQQFPLAISASIAMEQSYGHIDGDSASLAELCCLISALTRTPIKQGFAMTGSINQYGEVQAIGGVNEKIEGFFELCAARGLTGRQAVIIPTSNKRNLMLKREVVDAVERGEFAIYAVSNVDEALSLLTGQEAGTMNAEGQYPEGSVNFKAVARLKEISEMTSDDDKETETGA